MVTEKELLDAIDECRREPITGIKIGRLADLLTVHHYLYGNAENADPVEKSAVIALSARGNSEFLNLIDGKRSDRVWAVLDELMSTLEVINPRLYDGVMRRLED